MIDWEKVVMALKDLTGCVFERLIVLSLHGKDCNGHSQWVCQCACGYSIIALGTNLLRKYTKSCGCLRDELSSKRSKTHGMRKHRCYGIWAGAKNRCLNPNVKAYILYGGRGIRVSEDWMIFDNFWKDMGESYFNGATLDRIDPNGNYCKENCRWVEKELQGRNTRKPVTNRSGTTGVCAKNRAGNKEGWVAFWTELDGAKRSKYFSIREFGDNGAFILACEYRSKMIKELNKQGAGYTSTHGL